MSKNVEAIFPLSAAQEGILFHSLYAPVSGVYASQLSCRLIGQLDLEAFRGAWESLVERHGALRTAFVWEGVEQPLQVVLRRAELPFAIEDWRSLVETERKDRLRSRRKQDLEGSYDLEKAPLFRLSLLRSTDQAWEFIWTWHHLILDGWSLAVVMGEFLELYQRLVRGEDPVLEPPKPFSVYLAWLRRQDGVAAEQFWRRRLKGFEAATPLAVERSDDTEQGASVQVHRCKVHRCKVHRSQGVASGGPAISRPRPRLL